MQNKLHKFCDFFTFFVLIEPCIPCRVLPCLGLVLRLKTSLLSISYFFPFFYSSFLFLGFKLKIYPLWWWSLMTGGKAKYVGEPSVAEQPLWVQLLHRTPHFPQLLTSKTILVGICHRD